MNGEIARLKPSFLEAGLPCASLSAECQRDNNARQHPPQNRLHIWWARRPPTICRAAVLAALLPHDLTLPEEVLPPLVEEPTEADLENLPPKLLPHRAFFEELLATGRSTELSPAHAAFLRSLGICGDSLAAYKRIQKAQEYKPDGLKPINMGQEWSYRHPPAFTVSPLFELLSYLKETIFGYFGNPGENSEIVILDPMAGGGSIPLEGLRYGLKVYANELNPVAAIVLKATLEYPAKNGLFLLTELINRAKMLAASIETKLYPFFYRQDPEICGINVEKSVKRGFPPKT